MTFTLGENVQFLKPTNLTKLGTLSSGLQKAEQYISSFFSGKSGKVALTGLKVGAGVGIAGLGIGAGLNQLSSNVPDITTGKGISSWLIIGIIAFIVLMVIMKR